MKSWVTDITIKKAKESVFPKFRHGAVVEKGGRIISQGVNVPKPRTPNGSFSSHAEIYPLKRILTLLARQRRKDKYELYVARVDQEDKIAMSKPCDKCMAAIKESGVISVVHYSTSNGWNTINI